MTIIHGDYPAGKTPPGRGLNSREAASRREGGGKKPVVPEQVKAGAAAEIRARLVELQRSVTRHQRLLGGLYGLRDLLLSDPEASGGQAKARIAAMIAAGEPVPETLSEDVQALADRGDLQSLSSLIRSTEQAIARLSASLGKTEIADQNARSLAVRESLAEVARGLREEGALPQRLNREQVLKLLS